MSALGVRRAGLRQILQLIRRFQQGQILRHLLRITISLALLPLDSTILFVAIAIGHLSSLFSHSGPAKRRSEILRDVQFRPKTILITGVNTPHGLRVARCFYQEGHRVVGADITDIALASGESMSRALLAYYRIPKPQYGSKLLDVIQREKADLWIPCSQDTSVMEDAMAKQSIESKTGCKCITLDAEVAMQWSHRETFMQYLIENDLPIMECHQVQSRDSIHRILHRSPTKLYHLRRSAPALKQDTTIVLPKRTLSLTYLEVSEIQVSKDCPWLMQQQSRLGEFVADLLVVRGHVAAITIRPAKEESDWGCSPLNDGVAAAIQKLMENFALKSGPRNTGHLSVRLMVDQELNVNSIRYVVHIAACAHGAATITQLLHSTPVYSLISGYLAICSESGVVPNHSPEVLHGHNRTGLSKNPSQRPSLFRMLKGYDVRKVLPALYPVAQLVDRALYEVVELLFWKNWRFSTTDPLPWWWHTHVYQPSRELNLVLQHH
ncbi:hypothetical protein BDW59DRAFT_152229 [Aspergillus cavernicola]|uniref:ATP-grasp domain-containing protein n=1 Tax=Aspergillus cavernicola TaxID=176166 RepID=A0ABR4HRR1_9EURO